jgi:hypothetical protein
VGLTDSTRLFTVTNSPVTTSGSLTLSAYASQTANYVLRSGSGTPTFSALALTDLPAIAASNLSNGVTGTGNVVLKSGPTLTGVPLAPTASALTNNTQIATTGYADAAVAVEVSRAEIAEALLSPLASPTFTGTAAFANITVSGTTSFAANAISLASVSGAAPLASPAFTGTPSLPTGTTGITQSAGTANTTIATTQFVTTAVGTLSDAFSSITTGINVPVPS